MPRLTPSCLLKARIWQYLLANGEETYRFDIEATSGIEFCFASVGGRNVKFADVVHYSYRTNTLRMGGPCASHHAARGPPHPQLQYESGPAKRGDGSNGSPAWQIPVGATVQYVICS